MKVVGIIAEYNPFHKGHEYQIRYAREILGADYIVIAMSGDLSKEGLLPLWKNISGLRCSSRRRQSDPGNAGTDSNGQCGRICRRWRKLLDGLGVVDELCFGSECGDTETLMNIAQILVKEPFEYRKLLQQNLRTGMSFPAARSSALIRYMREKATSVHNTFGVSSEHIELILLLPITSWESNTAKRFSVLTAVSFLMHF